MVRWGPVRSGPDGYLRPVQFLDHLTVIIKSYILVDQSYIWILNPNPNSFNITSPIKVQYMLFHTTQCHAHSPILDKAIKLRLIKNVCEVMFNS